MVQILILNKIKSLIVSLKLKLGVDNTCDGTAHVINYMQRRYNCAKNYKERRGVIRYQLPQLKTCRICIAYLLEGILNMLQ